MYYVDTSVLVPYYYPERLSPEVHNVLGNVKQPVISPLVELEFCSAISAKVRTKELEAAAAARILNLLRKHLTEGYYNIIPVDIDLYRQGIDWIGRLSSSLRTLDAIHLAAAFANDLTLLTADAALARSAEQFEVRCKLVQ